MNNRQKLDARKQRQQDDMRMKLNAIYGKFQSLSVMEQMKLLEEMKKDVERMRGDDSEHERKSQQLMEQVQDAMGSSDVVPEYIKSMKEMINRFGAGENHVTVGYNDGSVLVLSMYAKGNVPAHMVLSDLEDYLEETKNVDVLRALEKIVDKYEKELGEGNV